MWLAQTLQVIPIVWVDSISNWDDVVQLRPDEGATRPGTHQLLPTNLLAQTTPPLGPIDVVAIPMYRCIPALGMGRASSLVHQLRTSRFNARSHREGMGVGIRANNRGHR